jgi:toxin-antitoxin system PIN domain toxin
MLLPDVNVLIAGHRVDHPAHAAAKQVLDQVGARGFALCAHAWNGFIRLATHPNIFAPPTPLGITLDTVREWRSRPDARVLHDTAGSWDAYERLCRAHGATGNAVYDLHLAALAIAHRCVLVSSDRGFARIDGLRWKTPEALA